jgi:hypothetical protein
MLFTIFINKCTKPLKCVFLPHITKERETHIIFIAIIIFIFLWK